MKKHQKVVAIEDTQWKKQPHDEAQSKKQRVDQEESLDTYDSSDLIFNASQPVDDGSLPPLAHREKDDSDDDSVYSLNEGDVSTSLDEEEEFDLFDT